MNFKRRNDSLAMTFMNELLSQAKEIGNALTSAQTANGEVSIEMLEEILTRNNKLRLDITDAISRARAADRDLLRHSKGAEPMPEAQRAAEDARNKELQRQASGQSPTANFPAGPKPTTSASPTPAATAAANAKDGTFTGKESLPNKTPQVEESNKASVAEGSSSPTVAPASGASNNPKK